MDMANGWLGRFVLAGLAAIALLVSGCIHAQIGNG